MEIIDLTDERLIDSSEVATSALLDIPNPNAEDIIDTAERLIASSGVMVAIGETGRVEAVAAFSHIEASGVSVLDILACIPETQGRGVGKALLAAVEARVISVSAELHLESTPGAAGFYEGQGFGPSDHSDFTHMKQLIA